MIPRELVFSPEEYQRRLGAVRARMSDSNIEALILTSAPNVYYLSGFDTENLGDPQFLVIDQEEPPLLVVRRFESGRVENTVSIEHVLYYENVRDAVDLVVSGLRLSTRPGTTVGIERRTRGLVPTLFIALCDRLREVGAEIRDQYGVVEECRLLKSGAELDLMRRAGHLSERAIAAGCAAMRVGHGDNEVGAVIAATLYSGGSDLVCWGPVVAAGYRAATPHCSFNGRRLAHGDTVFLELTAEIRRYTAPLMCTAIVGRPSRDVEAIADAGRRALEAAMETAHQGVLASVVADKLDGILQPILAEHDLYLPDRYGYSVGIGFPPSWDEELGFDIRPDNHRALQAGMTFHLPISLRHYGEFAINQSATIAITETGAEALARPLPQLPVVRSAR